MTKTELHSRFSSRLRMTLYVALAIVLLIQPILHHHPLRGGDSDSSLSTQQTCALCAVGTDRVILSAAAFVPPTLDSFQLPALTFALPVSVAIPASGARGPPSSLL